MASELIGWSYIYITLSIAMIVCVQSIVGISLFVSQRELCVVLSPVSTRSSTIRRPTAVSTTPELKTGIYDKHTMTV